MSPIQLRPVRERSMLRMLLLLLAAAGRDRERQAFHIIKRRPRKQLQLFSPMHPARLTND